MDVHPKKIILEVLKRHPEGLTITSLAENSGLHRHTVTKYIKDLILSGDVQEREVGMAKLCYLSENLPKDIEIGSKAETGQTQVFLISMFLLLVPALIIAQTISNSTTTTGSFLETIDTSFTTLSSDLQTTSSFINNFDESTVSTTVKLIEDSPNYAENSTLESAPDDFTSTTLDERATSELVNNTLSSTESANETTLISTETTTSETGLETTVTTSTTTSSTVEIEFPSEIQPLDVKIEMPEKITRGNSINLKTIVKNTFPDSKTISIKWILPNGFSIVSGNEIEKCDGVEQDSSCISEISASVSESAELGKNPVKVVVSYE